MAQQISLCVTGFGSASQAFCRMLLQQRHALLKDHHTEVRITGIAGRSKGSLLDPAGINLVRAMEEVTSLGAFSKDNPQYTTEDTRQIIKAAQADVLLELTTLSIDDGQPAIRHIETALSLGMHVITANKGPIAWDYKRLKELATAQDRLLLHETVVMDGAPVFSLTKETLPGCQVLSFKGILNSTTNFILEEMENEGSYEEAIKEAQRRGFAEADPSLDVDGWDAAAKTSALLNTLMNAQVTPPDIERTGISHITPEEIKKAQDQGFKIKLLCEGWFDSGQAVGRVHPVWIRTNDLFSTIDATTSILCLQTDLMGEICVVERHPEIEQTAYGIFSDLLTLLRKKHP